MDFTVLILFELLTLKHKWQIIYNIAISYPKISMKSTMLAYVENKLIGLSYIQKCYF